MNEAKQDAITEWLNKLADGVNNSNTAALRFAETLYDKHVSEAYKKDSHAQNSQILPKMQRH